MNISTYSAHIIREGIRAARLDLAEHDEEHRHEPARAAADCMAVSYGSFFLYSQLSEKAYLHTIEREESTEVRGADSAVAATSKMQVSPRLAV